MCFPKLRRGLLEHRAEGPCECFVLLIARIERDFGHRLPGEAQAVRGSLQPQPTHVLFNRFSNHPAEDAMEMERRKVCDVSQFIKRERGVEMILDMQQNAQQALLVIFDRALTHCSFSP